MAAESFAALYAEQSARVRRALVLAGADPDLAADVAQEAFARTYARWRRVRTGSNPAGYVFRVAFRELRRRGQLPDEPDGDAAASACASREPGPEDQALVNIAVAAARAAIEAMPASRRACALLVLVAGVPAGEAAQALGLAASTVRVQVHRARADLLAMTDPKPSEAEEVVVSPGARH